eukprot:Opistho-2@37262
MNYIGRILSGAKEFYKDLNPATLSGAIDIVVVEQPDGSLACSPFHVRFGKLHILRSKEKVVDIEVNDEPVDVKMKLGDAGEAFFVKHSAVSASAVPAYLVTSPLPRPSSPDSPDMEPLSIGPSAVPEASLSLGPAATAPASGGTDSIPASPASDSGFDYAFGADGKPLTPTGEAWTWGWGDLPAHAKDALGAAPHADAAAPTTSTSLPASSAGLLSSKSESEIISVKTTVGFDLPAEGQESTSSFPTAPDAAASSGAGEGGVVEGVSAAAAAQARLAQAHSKGSWMGSIMNMLRKPEGPNPQSSPDVALASTSAPSLSSGAMKTAVAAAVKVREDEDLEGGVYLSELSPDQESKYFDDIFDGFGEDDYEPKASFLRSRSPEGQSALVTEAHAAPSADAAGRIPGVGRASSALSDTHGDPISRQTSLTVSKAAEGGVDSSWPPAGGLAAGPFEAAALADNDIPILSLCGVPADGCQPTQDAFLRERIDFVRLCGRPDLIANPNLVVLYGGKYYTARAALPLLVSLSAFGRPLPRDVLQHMAPELRSRDIPRSQSERKGWLWGRWSAGDDRSSGNMGASAESLLVATPSANAADTQLPTGRGSSPMLASAAVVQQVDSVSVAMGTVRAPGLAGARSDSEASLMSTGESYVKTLCLDSDQLKELRLRPGANTIKFSVTTKLQGTATCVSSIFFWRHDAKIVISDVDGTITKSDVMGHILPALRMDWTHSGVAGLYSGMKKNGYEILYLSSRAIGQANITRGFLKGVRQGEITLPDGPVLLSPDRLLTSFTREVIRRKPEEFKIACLQSVRSLFPADTTFNPFYAGFGNRITDAISYRSVGVPEKRIFTINPQGEVKLELISSFKTSYLKLGDLLDHMFPPINGRAAYARGEVDDSFNNFNFWRAPLPDLAGVVPTTAVSVAITNDASPEDAGAVSVGAPSLLHHSVSVPSLTSAAVAEHV